MGSPFNTWSGRLGPPAKLQEQGRTSFQNSDLQQTEPHLVIQLPQILHAALAPLLLQRLQDELQEQAMHLSGTRVYVG